MKPKLSLSFPPNNCSNPTAGAADACCRERQDTYIEPCDGICQSNLLGSACGTEEVTSLVTAMYLWADAIIETAARGGGLIDPLVADLAARQLADQECEELLGREVGNELLGLVGEDLFHHPDDQHEFQDHPVADLSATPCLIEVMRALVDAYAAELQWAGAADERLDSLPQLCPGALDSVLPCPLGDNLECTKARVREFAVYLRTPKREQ